MTSFEQFKEDYEEEMMERFVRHNQQEYTEYCYFGGLEVDCPDSEWEYVQSVYESEFHDFCYNLWLLEGWAEKSTEERICS